MNSTFPLEPRNPDLGLFTVVIGRISDPKQNLSNIDASYRYVEDRLRDAVRQKMSFKYLGEQSSGYITDRQTMLELRELMEQNRVDLIVAEDISRIYRNPALQWSFVQRAVDRRIHVICFADNLDTRRDDWQIVLGTAALRHGLAIPDTIRRVRRTATHAFHNGGMVQKVRFGYRKLTRDEAQSGAFGPVGLRLAKVPEHTPTLQEMKRRVLDRESYNSIGRWLKEQGIVTGDYVGEGGWTGRLVRQLLADPLLSGTRRFRVTLFERLFETGHHTRLPNANPEVERCENLAHYTDDEHIELLQAMLERAEAYRKKRGKDHPRHGRPRSEVPFPCQHIRCICGAHMYSLGKYMRCCNTLPDSPQSCWNRVQVPLKTMRDRFIDWLVGILDSHSGLRDIVVTATCEEIQRVNDLAGKKGRANEMLIVELTQQAKRLAKAIAKNPESDALQDELIAVEKQIATTKRQEARLATGNVLASVRNAQDILDQLPAVLRTMADSSCGFGKLIRKLLPVFYIQPVQALDRPQIHPRLKLMLSTAAFCKVGEEPIEVSACLDVFEAAACITNVQRNMNRAAEAKEHNPKLNLNGIADHIGVHHMELKRSRAYWRLMQKQGTDDPFVELALPPANASRWRKKAKAG